MLALKAYSNWYGSPSFKNIIIISPFFPILYFLLHKSNGYNTIQLAFWLAPPLLISPLGVTDRISISRLMHPRGRRCTWVAPRKLHSTFGPLVWNNGTYKIFENILLTMDFNFGCFNVKKNTFIWNENKIRFQYECIMFIYLFPDTFGSITMNVTK